MKKLLFITLLTLTFSLGANAQSTLSDWVTLLNNECPMEVDTDLTLDKVFSTSSEVVVRMTTDNNEIVSFMALNSKDLNLAMEESVAEMSLDSDMQTFFSLIVREKKNLVFEYVGKKSGQKVRFTLTPAQLESIITKDVVDTSAAIEVYLELMKAAGL